MMSSNVSMNTRLVLDTSAVLAYFHGSKAATEVMNRAEVVYLPSVFTLEHANVVDPLRKKSKLRL